MTRVPITAILATAAFGALLGGCATTIQAGPGYYRYDTGLASPNEPPVVYQAPAVVYQAPAIVYREPAVVYEPTVVYRGAYREPGVVYRYWGNSFSYTDHGQ